LQAIFEAVYKSLLQNIKEIYKLSTTDKNLAQILTYNFEIPSGKTFSFEIA
jgi:hypothetical protein